MEKEIALALNFAKAPEELKKAAQSYGDSVKLLSKAKKKRDDAIAEIFALEVQTGELQKQLERQLKSWDPEAKV